ncbi:MAG: isoaspartyl peptidase/L-asparaginase [Acidobacteria bacterium]|nr:isoaspartyl peptidase/L-asparaginase [Acidobacteriota bacterium]
MKKLALVVHGGAWAIPETAAEACREGCRRALERGWALLGQGGSALDACEQAIIELENDPIFDAGLGSHLNRDGRVQLDAILMDGRTLKAGAVAAVERVRNPVHVARLVLDRSEHIMLVGEGAEQFAVEAGVSLCNVSELVIAREVELWYKLKNEGPTAPGRRRPSAGTVGAVACDAQGNLAAGTSTGGTACKYPGRVGDSSLIGCGCYADNRAGAVSATGYGEAIMKVVLAKSASDLLAAGLAPQVAAERALAVLRERAQGTGGLILVDPQGRVGATFTTPHMAHAFRTSDSAEAVVRL